MSLLWTSEALVEAMEGRPIGSLPDGITGIVLPAGDAHDAAASIARLLAHEDQRAAMGGAGRVRVARDYTETLMVDAFERAALAASDRSSW